MRRAEALLQQVLSLPADNGQAEAQTAAQRKKLPDLSDFRAGLKGKPYPGNSVVDLREDERS